MENKRKIIVSTPLKKAPGPDISSIKVLKNSQDNVIQALTDIINCSLFKSNFRTAWKLAEVEPLPKEGDHEIASNNRPL